MCPVKFSDIKFEDVDIDPAHVCYYSTSNVFSHESPCFNTHINRYAAPTLFW